MPTRTLEELPEDLRAGIISYLIAYRDAVAQKFEVSASNLLFTLKYLSKKNGLDIEEVLKHGVGKAA